MEISKDLTPYCVVTFKRNKIVKASKKSKPFGIWYPHPETITVKTRLTNGELHITSMNVPAGIRVYGPSKCLISMEDKNGK